MSGIGAIIECAAEPGFILYSSSLQPRDLHLSGLSWWYVAPGNGHISMFSRESLAAAFGRSGYKTVSFNHCVHCAFRTLPTYLAQVQGEMDELARQESSAAA